MKEREREREREGGARTEDYATVCPAPYHMLSVRHSFVVCQMKEEEEEKIHHVLLQ